MSTIDPTSLREPTSAGRVVRPRAGAKDVAQLAGVSMATVSRALNSPAQLDPDTLKRVLEAANMLRYVPHATASSLRSQRSKMVGAIVPSFDYALYARTTSALQQRLDAHGYALVVAEHHYDLEVETRVATQLVQRGIDALVFVGLDHAPALFSMMQDFGKPYVLTWGVDPAKRHPSIGFDNEAATWQMTRHLIGLGHKRFGLLSAPPEGNDRARLRGNGMRMALREAGLSLDPRCVAYGPISLDAAQIGMECILAQDDPPTALIATNDVFAVGAMLACRRAGIRVPQDISITGVDNTDLGATQTPGLTSIRTPVAEVGDAAAAQLLARLQGKEAELFQSFPFEIVHRGSVAEPRSKD